MNSKALRKLTVLRDEAESTPVPSRKFFHIGQVTEVEEVGLCLPMIAWIDDNLSRFIVASVPSTQWGREDTKLVCLPNLAVKNGDGIFLVGETGKNVSTPHPAGKGSMHFVYVGDGPAFAKGLSKLYVYRLDGVQVKGLARV